MAQLEHMYECPVKGPPLEYTFGPTFRGASRLTRADPAKDTPGRSRRRPRPRNGGPTAAKSALRQFAGGSPGHPPESPAALPPVPPPGRARRAAGRPWRALPGGHCPRRALPGWFRERPVAPVSSCPVPGRIGSGPSLFWREIAWPGGFRPVRDRGRPPLGFGDRPDNTPREIMNATFTAAAMAGRCSPEGGLASAPPAI
jgi:hypothetical protein